MKQVLRLLIVIFLTIGSIDCYAQKPAKLSGQPFIDSLLKELPKLKEDTNKVSVLVDISFAFSRINPDEGIKYGQQGLELATQLEWEKGMASTNGNLGVNYANKSDYPKALAYYTTTLRIDEEKGNEQSMAKVTGNIGNLYEEQGDYPRALEYDFKALKMAEDIGDKYLTASTTGNIGIVYDDQGDYPRALEYDFKALKTLKEIGDKEGVATVTGNIGTVYGEQRDYPRALEYYFKALKMDEEIENKNSAALVTGNIGYVYTKLKNYDMAITYGKKALEMDEEIGRKGGAAYAFEGIGSAYLASAEDTLHVGSITLAQKLPSGVVAADLRPTRSSGRALIPIGKSARLGIAVDYLQRGLDSAKKINVLDVEKDCYELLAEAYKAGGDFKKAMEYRDNYMVIKDSIFSQENAKKIHNLEDERKEEADSLKSAHEKHLADIKYQHQRNLTYLLGACAIALIAFSFFIIKERKKLVRTRKKSEELLLNILPLELAEELKNRGETTPRAYTMVTVMFTDMVGFTTVSANMPAELLVDELNACFSAFDDIIGQYGIEKIKTIGDAYLCAGGLPKVNYTHAVDIVKAAIKINQFMQKREVEKKQKGEIPFQIRIGVNTGPVVGGVVGKKKFVYDIWGDTVNTAQRMESNSEPGRINISQTTYDLVKDKFSCTSRGEINAKNKGMMKMYFVS